MSKLPLALSAPKQNLRRLLAIRSVLVVSLLAAIAFAHFSRQLPLPYATLTLILAGLTIISTLTLVRLGRSWPVTEGEFFGQIVIDIASVTLLLYFSGGAGNPFVSYYLVPLSISAATLAWHYTWIVALLSLAAYSGLLFYSLPIAELAPPSGHHHAGGELNLHIIGMWLNFVVSAGLITYFVVKMAAALREQEAQLAAHREDNLRDEQLMAVATLAAGTAHELGTPLSTIKVLLAEMRADYRDNRSLNDDLALLQSQVDHCRDTLHQLVRQAGQASGDGPRSLRAYCNQLIDKWLLMRPDVKAKIRFNATGGDREASIHPTVDQSIINLLNNAADASPEQVEVDIDWTEQQLCIDIGDRGKGVPVELADQLGKPFLTSKGKGLGLGLFLTHATLSRYNGTVKLYNREGGGTLTELRLALAPTETASAPAPHYAH
ncbi:HAMP domain-containing histidine kinase [Exilibacterium tricleocarpae]|uniref:histidine kinase n=1 Tax=Exilibacterium tricleocarpae TaxID=2591008 RepID=A0A545TSK4_9GAMM|nr:ATP-binding protein [Exilibacterium tricleocarpae]TQV80121.1 HAMP domain-containing histidine kinase [Exilibacterium tricleocarpae]